MTGTIEIHYDRNFDTLLFDSVEMLFRSRGEPYRDEYHQTFARSSMLFSMLMLEAVANTCIETLDLERSIFREIDMLPVLAKFDFYLRTKFRNKRLERRISVVEGIKELKRLRDGFVHLKPHKVEWKMTGDSGIAEAERTKVLKIAKNPQFWDADDALATMKGVHDFFNYFFKSKCKYNPTRVASLLLSESRVTGDDNYGIPVFDRKIELMELGIDLSYIRLL